jgi:hypothetical protein
MFIAALFTIAKLWKQPRCPSTVLHSLKYTLFNTIYKSAVISACTQHKNKEIPYILSVLICFSLNVSLGTSHGSSAQQFHEARCTTLASTVLEESKANFISLE